jgi:hypothetical protein
MRQDLKAQLGFEAADVLPDIDVDLKSERVQTPQMRMAAVLGWAEQASPARLHRTRRFATAGEAEGFAAFVLNIATRRRQPVVVELAGKRVSVTLKSLPGRAVTSGITNAVFDLACALG